MEANPSRRIQKVERALREAIGSFLISGYKGSLRGLVSVTRVDVTPDLQKARIYISVLGSENDRNLSFESLTENVSEIQRFVGRELNMRYCPRLTIVEDTSQPEFHIQ